MLWAKLVQCLLSLQKKKLMPATPPSLLLLTTRLPFRTSSALLKARDGNFHVSFTGEGASAACCEETAKPKNWALFVGKDFIGDGSEELGTSLMTMFFYTLAESNDAPRYILFMNSGVKLPVENDQVVEHLKALQEKGSEILVCGTCLKFFGIADNLKIGTVSNMYDISERMHLADKVITL